MKTTVYLVFELKSEDYHGTYKDVVGVYSNKNDAIKKIEQLEKENINYNIDYMLEKYSLL